jgi:hypothetical protein
MRRPRTRQIEEISPRANLDDFLIVAEIIPDVNSSPQSSAMIWVEKSPDEERAPGAD